MTDKLLKFIVEVNTNGKAHDEEVYAESGEKALKLLAMRLNVPQHMLKVRGIA